VSLNFKWRSCNQPYYQCIYHTVCGLFYLVIFAFVSTYFILVICDVLRFIASCNRVCSRVCLCLYCLCNTVHCLCVQNVPSVILGCFRNIRQPAVTRLVCSAVWISNKMFIVRDCRVVLPLNSTCTRLPGCIRLRNNLYCVGWGIKVYSLTHCSLIRILTNVDPKGNFLSNCLNKIFSVSYLGLYASEIFRSYWRYPLRLSNRNLFWKESV